MEHSEQPSPIEKVDHKDDDDDFDDDKRLLKSLEAQLSKAIEKGNAYKNLIREKNQRIGKLKEDVEKREDLLELCMNNENEVYLTSEENDQGHRIYDIRNRQKIPFWIKTEQLSPLIHKNSEDEDIKVADIVEDDCTLVDIVPLSQTPAVNLIEDNQQNSNVDDSGVCENFMESVNDSSSFTLSPNSKLKEEREYFSELLSRSSSRLNKRGISPSSSSTPTVRNQQEELTNYFNTKKFRFDSQEENEASTKRSLSISKSPPHQSFSLPVSTQSSENVLEIPEILRYNFGTSDFELGDCPIGLNFWFDSENSQCAKYFLKLHDDSGNWRRDRKFVLIEQINLCYPKFYHLKFDKIMEKLNKSPNKRIWLHVRDFDIFSASGQKILGGAITKSITHFSLGTRLYSEDVLKSHLLLDFIFGHLPSLEYLSLNNGMICKLDPQKGQKPGHMKKLRKLKTLRVIFSMPTFPMSIITSILKMSPHLQFLYGVPLSSLQKLSSKNLLKHKVKIGSIHTKRSNYRANENRALDFRRDLKFLSGSKIKRNSLEQFQAQGLFLQCKVSTKSRCIKAMAKIIERHKNSIRKLKLEPFHKSNKMLKLPRMKNLTTLQFDVNRREGFEKEQTSFFPKGFKIRENFPALNSIEILKGLSNPNFRDNYEESPLDLFDKLFPPAIFKPGKCFNRVKILKLYGFANLSCMLRLAQLFPNVQLLRLYCGFIDAAEILPHFYSLWPRLEQLHLEINVDNRKGNLDSALSGIDKKSCELIREENLDREIDEEKFQKYCKIYKKHSSIRSMKDLRMLNFVLRPPSEFVQVCRPIFSPFGASAISGAGKQDEKLQVLLSFDERTTTNEREEIISTHSSILSLPFIQLNR